MTTTRQGGGFTPRLDYEAWRDVVRSNYGGDPQVGEPHAFAAWRRQLTVFGFAADACKTQYRSGAVDPGGYAYRLDRTQRDVRHAGMGHYYVLLQGAGRSVMAQNDQAFELAEGDVALIDMSRPGTLANNGNVQWLCLLLPRQPLIAHLGFEPQGGFCGRGGTLATAVLYQLVRDAVEDEASLSAPAGAFMQLAIYDLFGALFAPSDPLSIPPHRDKLFRRVCAIIKDRYFDPELGPCEVAAEAGISLRYLQKLFTERGSTCAHFIQSLRLDHAARLLRRRALLGTSRPISEIAYASGFNDYSYFSQRFRWRFGHAPSALAGNGPPEAVPIA